MGYIFLDSVGRQRAAGVKGKLIVKISREQLMTWTENFVDNLNSKEKVVLTNIYNSPLLKETWAKYL